ncbi:MULTISPECIES: ribbon-helix-helix protein, CopG family [Terrabacteria group]|uniref:ribbon-helix-helix protein, CopG family n=1 Tax=Bacillati TaxID=1783272 RepID=UPI001C6EEA70|nr:MULTISPECIES: ribbon-helix-helix protein, CopG family [Terrabacteria group]MBW9212821.1 hypothetical protein [Trueperella sp. zg.1013]
MSAKKMRFKPNESGYKSKRLEIRLDEKSLEKLEYLANQKGLTKAGLIRHWIEKAK